MELTNKEKEIFEMNAMCITRKEICKKLNITRSTLQSHFNNIAIKLGMPERINMQYYFACAKIKQLQKDNQI